MQTVKEMDAACAAESREAYRKFYNQNRVAIESACAAIRKTRRRRIVRLLLGMGVFMLLASSAEARLLWLNLGIFCPYIPPIPIGWLPD